MFQRSLMLPAIGGASFFLWGPRQTGKSTLLRAHYGGRPEVHWINLLRAASFDRYQRHPGVLDEELRATKARLCVIDEVQKVPALLDEVHHLIETRGVQFALCGSSARKVRRGHANLLGGRALRFELFGLTAHEIGASWSLAHLLQSGYLPRHYGMSQPRAALRAYVADYLKEEVAAEGLVRKLPAYSEFLRMAALSDAELLNFSTIARDCGVSAPTIRGYFEILTDTMLGRFLPAFQKRPKRRVIGAPKFYFADVGVVNYLAKRRMVVMGSSHYGKALENWVFHELSAYNSYAEVDETLAYWRLASGIEVDFIVGDMGVAIEVKSTTAAHQHHLKSLRALAEDHPDIGKQILLCHEPTPRLTNDGIHIWNPPRFIKALWNGEIF